MRRKARQGRIMLAPFTSDLAFEESAADRRIFQMMQIPRWNKLQGADCRARRFTLIISACSIGLLARFGLLLPDLWLRRRA